MVSINIERCDKCPNFKLGPSESTDGFDLGNDWICELSGRIIAGFVEWHEENKIKIPDWCEAKISTMPWGDERPRNDKRPCDCKSQSDVSALPESGMKINEHFIEVRPNSVIIGVPQAEMKLPMSHFKKFAEWYLGI